MEYLRNQKLSLFDSFFKKCSRFGKFSIGSLEGVVLPDSGIGHALENGATFDGK
jgi:hypothetical protein